MRLAVGTLRRAKLEAVERAVESLRRLGWPPGGVSDVVPVAVPSGVSEMPMSEAEGVTGARNRARAALASSGADLALGLEGGVAVLDARQRIVVLRNWAAATDGGNEWVASGPGLQLPLELAGWVLDGVELGDAIDRWSRGHDIRSGRGTFGVLTGDLIDRPHAFEDAVLGALAPWYNPGAFDPPEGGSLCR